MKFKLTILLLSVFYCIQFISAKPIETNDSIQNEKKEQAKIKKNRPTHWSIAFNGGISMFDGDIQHTENLQILPNSYVNFAFNFQVEYLINPVWGLFLQYNYLPYSASIADNMNLKAISHDVTINGTVNLVNLFRANNRRRTKWGLNINVGAGCAFYNGDSYKYLPERKFEELEQKDFVHGRSFVIPVGITVEYAPIEALGIFLQADYRLYQKDKLEGILSGQSKDGMGYVGLGLRYKIAASKKRQHAKTGYIETVIPPKYDEYIVNNNKTIDSLSASIDSITRDFNDKLNLKLAELEKENIDTDKDGVPDNRDRHPNTPLGSYVNYYGEPLTQDDIDRITNRYDDPITSIYFASNSVNLVPRDYIDIAKVAEKLSNDTTLNIQIVGYCDSTGPEEFNTKLSQERSDNIKKIFVDMYKIDESRITTIGKGQLKGPKNRYIVNRRCDIFIVK